MSKKDVENFVKQYTAVKFRAIKIEAHKPEGLRVERYCQVRGDQGRYKVCRSCQGVEYSEEYYEKIGYRPNESSSSALHSVFLFPFILFVI